MKKEEYIKRYGIEAYKRQLEYQKRYYAEHKVEISEYYKQYNAEHKVEISEYKKQYNAEHKEERSEYQKRYNAEHKEEKSENQKRYNKTPMGRAAYLANSYSQEDKKYNRGESTITAKWIVDNVFTSKCHYCGESDWHRLGCDRIDNTLPHTPDNVVCCCYKCNVERQKMNFIDFCQKKGVG